MIIKIRESLFPDLFGDISREETYIVKGLFRKIFFSIKSCVQVTFLKALDKIR